LALLDDADAAAQRVTLGLVVGTNVSAIASPAFTGTPTAPSPSAATNTTQIATTAYTRTAIADVLNAAGSAPLYACRAWVSFDGGGTVSINGSANVSSITDNGTGDYTVNFSTAMPISNYAVGLSSQGASSGDVTRIAVIRANGGTPTLKTTSALRISTGRTSASDINDLDGVSVMIFC
jgi:hypothetical protein